MKLKDIIIWIVIGIILLIIAIGFGSLFQECKSDNDCLNKHSTKPYCYNRQRCVECLVDSNCKVGEKCKNNHCTIL